VQIAQVHHEQVEQSHREVAVHLLELRRDMDGVKAAAELVCIELPVVRLLPDSFCRKTILAHLDTATHTAVPLLHHSSDAHTTQPVMSTNKGSEWDLTTLCCCHKHHRGAGILAVYHAEFGHVGLQEDLEAGNSTLDDAYAEIEPELAAASRDIVTERTKLISTARSLKAPATAPSSMYVRVLMALISLVMALAIAVNVGRQWGLQQSMAGCWLLFALPAAVPWPDWSRATSWSVSWSRHLLSSTFLGTIIFGILLLD
jgi:hypothetical protein